MRGRRAGRIWNGRGESTADLRRNRTWCADMGVEGCTNVLEYAATLEERTFLAFYEFWLTCLSFT